MSLEWVSDSAGLPSEKRYIPVHALSLEFLSPVHASIAEDLMMMMMERILMLAFVGSICRVESKACVTQFFHPQSAELELEKIERRGRQQLILLPPASLCFF